MSGTPFWLMNASESELLARKLRHATQCWRDAWSRENLSSTVALLPSAADVATPMYRWRSGTTRRGLTAAVGVPVDADWGLGFALTGLIDAEAGPAHGDIARNLDVAALHGLIEALLAQGGQVEPAETIVWRGALPDAEELDPTRGCVAAEFQIQGNNAAVLLMLYPSTTRAYLAALNRPAKQGGSVIPLRRVIESQTVSVDVIAGEADLLLQEIACLSVGDVLRLDRKIDQPLQVAVDGSDSVGAGHLGVAGSHKAVQFISAPS